MEVARWNGGFLFMPANKEEDEALETVLKALKIIEVETADEVGAGPIFSGKRVDEKSASSNRVSISEK